MALATDQGLKTNFENAALFASLWREVKNEYPELAEITLKSLLLFQSSQLREADFPARRGMTRQQRTV